MTIQPFLEFPSDLTLSVFNYLNFDELSHCCGVNRKFRELGGSDFLWKELLSEIPVPEGIGRRAFFEDHVVTSSSQILQKISRAINGTPLDTLNFFHCYFPFHPGCRIKVTFGYGAFSIDEAHELVPAENAIRTICIYAKKNFVSHRKEKSLSTELMSTSPKLSRFTLLETLCENFSNLSTEIREIAKQRYKQLKEQQFLTQVQRASLLGSNEDLVRPIKIE